MSPVSPDKLSDRQLKFGHWYLLHRKGLRGWLVIILIVVDVLLIGFGLIGILAHYFFTNQLHDQMLLNLTQSGVNYEAHRARNQSLPPQIDRVNILSTGEGRYDFVVRLTNPNPNWALESFDYQFFYEGQGTDIKQGNLLPGEEKYFTALGLKSERQPRQASFDIQNIKWRWVTDYQSLAAERLDWNIEDITYVPVRTAGISERLPVSQTKFSITNSSPYSYWSTPMVVLLYRGSRLVAANQVVLDRFQSTQKREVEINWYESLSGVTKVDVRPQLNILDPTNYMSPQGDLQQLQ